MAPTGRSFAVRPVSGGPEFVRAYDRLSELHWCARILLSHFDTTPSFPIDEVVELTGVAQAAMHSGIGRTALT
jgi:hypothetical protein